MEDFIVAMLNMIGGGGAGSIATGMLSQGPETWNPALYQLAVNVCLWSNKRVRRHHQI